MPLARPGLGRLLGDAKDMHAFRDDLSSRLFGHLRPETALNSIMAKGDVVIANSTFTAGGSRAFIRRASRDRVIHRGVDLRAFSPNAVNPERVQALREAWGIAPGERIVLLAARLSPWKGHKILIEAARQLLSGGLTDIKFILVGDEKTRGTYLKEVDSAIARAGLTGFVRRTGYCADMPAALLAASVVVVPSTEPRGLRQGRGGSPGHGDARCRERPRRSTRGRARAARCRSGGADRLACAARRCARLGGGARRRARARRHRAGRVVGAGAFAQSRPIFGGKDAGGNSRRLRGVTGAAVVS